MKRRSWSVRRVVMTGGVACATVALCLLAAHLRWWPRATGALLGVTSARVLRTSEYPENHIQAFEGAVSDASIAWRLYDAVQALPPYPQGIYNCPMDLGVAYHLTFYRDGSQVAWANANPSGCGAVTLDDGDRRQANAQFWQIFADAFGLPQSQVFPFPTPGAAGPYAPTPVKQ